MSTVLKTLAVLAALGLAAAAAVVFGGLYNVSARAGHLPGVSWVLHTTYNQAVRLRAPPASEVPELTDDMAALGRGHFEQACAFCHSLPGEIRNATVLSMLPQPPHVTEAVEHWQPRHLHWILYEGVKMSGMPHWPARRPDEVWSVVAFLESVKAGSPAEPPNEARTDDETLAYCASCHGLEGRSGNGVIPRLDILGRAYLGATLTAYREGRRESGFMQHAARRVSDVDLQRMALHYADAAPEGEPPAQPDALAQRGGDLARSGTDEIPACTACHGPGATRGNPLIPALAGQYAPYLALQLRAWREGHRGGGARAELMAKSAEDLTDDDIAALAAWYASLPPGAQEQAQAD